jgi:Ni/Co efflux regulator RcnB
MKKFILSAVALTLVAGPMMTAPVSAQMHDDRGGDHGPQGNRGPQGDRGPQGNRGPQGDHRGPQANRGPQGDHRGGPQFRSDWRKGERFDHNRARNYRQIDYRQYRGLRAPPRGYRYYQSGNDAVLVGITSGIIAGVIAGAIR